MRQRISILLGICLVLLVSSTSSHASSQDIRIGLAYGAGAVASVSFSADQPTFVGNGVYGQLAAGGNYLFEPVKNDLYMMSTIYSNYEMASNALQMLILQDPYASIYLDEKGQYYLLTSDQLEGGVVLSQDERNIKVTHRDTHQVVFVYASRLNLLWTDQSKNYVTYQDKQYRGGLSFVYRSEQALHVVNQLELEDYLLGVVPKEMPASWEQQALKAQAIAARTYAIKNMGQFKEQGFDLCPTQRCQVYGGMQAEHPSASQAVEETAGEVGMFKGALAELFYSASSGGQLESPANIWSEDYPYLVVKEDPYSLDDPYRNWSFELTSDQISQFIDQAIGTINSISLIYPPESKRVKEIILHGSSGEVSYKGTAFRSMVGLTKLKSSLFVVNQAYPPLTEERDQLLEQTDPDPFHILANYWQEKDQVKEREARDNAQSHLASDREVRVVGPSFVFTGSGFGHGVGLSQYGAKMMAEQGFTYEEIIDFYFPGVIIANY